MWIQFVKYSYKPNEAFSLLLIKDYCAGFVVKSNADFLLNPAPLNYDAHYNNNY